MTIAFDHGCGLLSLEDQEKMKLILKRLDATRGAPGLHGMLTASVVGPKPVPIDWILQAVLSHPQSEPIALKHLPEFCWLVEKIEELFLRLSLVFQQDPEMFRPLVYMRNLKEGGTTPDPRSWCFGFAEAVIYHRKAWAIHAFWPFYAKLRSPIRASVVLNRNDPCPCGSGRKYKRCCGSPLNEAVHPRR